MSSYLAVDVGTSAVKVALYDGNGKLLISKREAYPVSYPKVGWAEQNPDHWWMAAQNLCQLVRGEIGYSSLRGVCISGQAPSCVPVDLNGKPLRPAILWLDRRADDQVASLQNKLGPGIAEQITGNRLDGYFGGLKWSWYRHNEQELYDKTWKILQANSFVMHQLSGEFVVDPGQAGLCTPCFNINELYWERNLIEKIELDVEKLPEVRPSWDVIGEVTRLASTNTGIPVGTPVICGGGDFACACLGAGVFHEGEAAMMLGTGGNLLIPKTKSHDTRLINTIHLTGESLSLGGVLAGGSVQWFRDMLGIDDPNLLALLEAEAAQVPAGAEGLIFLPYLMGERTPIWDAKARGVFIGLSSTHKRGHLFRAVLEGVAFAYQQMMEVSAEMGCQIKEIITINGGAQSALWRQIFADILGVPIRWRPSSEGTSLGAAFLTAIGVGDFSDFGDIHAWLETTIDTYPNKANADIYGHRYITYTQIYNRLRDIFVELNS